ncbi:MAG: MBL fold metallo-hydrolase [Actinobacteria bacterium]|nr:MBL fold metallo-hydrolase [Actinomycetota bacterium]
MRIGEIDVTPFSDGFFSMPPAYFGESADWEPHKALLNDSGNLIVPIGCFIVRTGGQTVLVDAGLGDLDLGEMGKGGALPAELAAAGVTPDEIDVVVCTHLHLDHSGWLVKDGAPFFPNATVRFGAADWDQFVVDQHGGPQTAVDIKLLADLGRVETIDGDDVSIAPGITARAAPGHTHGHNVLVLSSGEERAMLLGDAVTCPVQLEEPDWSAMSDIDAALARRTREALWRELEGTDTTAVAAHFPGLEFGRVLPGKGKRYFSV